jgi:mycobactin peptide synthetase MbtE
MLRGASPRGAGGGPTPVPDTDVFLFTDGRPCAEGEEGEILLGGGGLSLGYVNSPAQTRRSFVVARVDGRLRRLYRTGDLAWRSPSGILMFRGRADRQVKVRGHRIEPAHLESVLALAVGASRCAVLPLRSQDNCYSGVAAL